MNSNMQSVMNIYQEADVGEGQDEKGEGGIVIGSEIGEAPVKRQKPILGGGAGSGVALPSCLVDNCGADLSGCKKYHQRHKVCEIHAKAPVALVDGLRQRFCQQCSRFHEVSEFDHMKRSCRRRLAGHNERRRKGSLESQKRSTSRRLKEWRKLNETSTEIGSPGNQNFPLL